MAQVNRFYCSDATLAKVSAIAEATPSTKGYMSSLSFPLGSIIYAFLAYGLVYDNDQALNIGLFGTWFTTTAALFILFLIWLSAMFVPKSVYVTDQSLFTRASIKPHGIYKRYIKPVLNFTLSFAIIALLATNDYFVLAALLALLNILAQTWFAYTSKVLGERLKEMDAVLA
jgi:hypothetical protein